MYRILHFMSNIATRSGVMNVVMNYFRYIDRSQILFDFVYFDEFENNYAQEIASLGGRSFQLSRPGTKGHFFREFDAFLQEHAGEYEVIHSHEPYMAGLLYPLLKKNRIKNIIVHSHATRWSDSKASSIRNSVLCLPLNKCVTHRFACSQAAGEFLFGQKEFYVLNNAIDTAKYAFSQQTRDKVREALGIQDRLVIGHVGRFNEPKNHSFLIDIFYEIQQKNKNSILLLVGDGPLESTIRQKADDLKLTDSVIFLGNRKDVNEIMQGMDLFVLPSLYEGLPLVGVEAQCSGLPIIMSTAITREIGLRNYYYIDLKREAKEWAEEILKVPFDSIDRENAREVLIDRGYDIKSEAKILADEYQKMIRGEQI